MRPAYLNGAKLFRQNASLGQANFGLEEWIQEWEKKNLPKTNGFASHANGQTPVKSPYGFRLATWPWISEVNSYGCNHSNDCEKERKAAEHNAQAEAQVRSIQTEMQTRGLSLFASELGHIIDDILRLRDFAKKSGIPFVEAPVYRAWDSAVAMAEDLKSKASQYAPPPAAPSLPAIQAGAAQSPSSSIPTSAAASAITTYTPPQSSGGGINPISVVILLGLLGGSGFLLYKIIT